MGFAIALIMTYATALTALITFGRYQYGLTSAAVIAWIVLMAVMMTIFRRKALWAAPSALAALFPPASLVALMTACAAGSTGCM
ncbi:MAG: hypothetical protein J7521_14780 [Caulobacter sp.]|nr:hypothetical protein [Caulobacter sp.]